MHCRLVQVDTPVSPGQDDLEKKPAPEQDDEVEIKNLRNTYYPFLTKPSEFLKHHPAEQDTRTLPDLKVSCEKSRRRRKLPEIPKDKKRTYSLRMLLRTARVELNIVLCDDLIVQYGWLRRREQSGAGYLLVRSNPFLGCLALEGLSLAEEFRAIDANTLVTPFSEQLYLEIDTSGNEPRSTFK